MAMPSVEVSSDCVVFEEFECQEPDVVQFFADAAEASREDLARRALSTGVVGLRAMGVSGHVEVVEREFLRLTQRFERALATIQGALEQKVQATFDPGQAESVSAKLAASITGAHGAAMEVVEQARGQLEKLIMDSFNPDLAT